MKVGQTINIRVTRRAHMIPKGGLGMVAVITEVPVGPIEAREMLTLLEASFNASCALYQVSILVGDDRLWGLERG